MKTKHNILHRFLVITPFILLISVFILQVNAAVGDVDTSFGAALTHVPAPIASTIAQTIVQPDGKIIATGSFSVANNVYKKNIVRFNADGTLDPTFNAPFLLSTGVINNITGFPFAIQSIALQSNGKILLAGQFDFPRQGLIRLNPDGSMDTAFNSQPLVVDLQIGYYVQVMPDDSMYYSGRRGGQQGLEYIERADSNGIPFQESQVAAHKFLVQPDGKVLIYSFILKSIRRLDATLTFTPSYDQSFPEVSVFANAQVYGVNSMLLQPDGKIILGGEFTTVNGFNFKNLVRLNSNGSIDASFNINAVGPNRYIKSMLLMPDGKLLVAGNFTSYNGALKSKFALLNADGTLVSSFAVPNNLWIVYDLDFASDGKILASGTNFGIPTQSNPNPGGNGSTQNFMKISTDGTPDDAFQPKIGENGRGYVVRVQPDNKILVGGDFTTPNSIERKFLVRFNPDGTVDTGFNQTIIKTPVNMLDILPDGKILAGGNPGIFESGNGIYRLNPDGSTDQGINSTVDAWDLRAQPDGKSLIAKNNYIIRQNVNASQDALVSVTQNTTINAIALQPDGKILIGGTFSDVAGVPRGRIARLNADMTLDTTFNPPGGANNLVFQILVQQDGKILIGGNFNAVNFDSTKKYLARLNSDGSLDTSFSPNLDLRLSCFKLEPGGKILIAGFPITGAIDSAPGKLIKLNPDGTTDSSFNPALNINLRISNFDFQSPGKIVIVGFFTYVNGVSSVGIARLLNTSRTMFDFDGDSKTDLSIFRPSAGQWWYSRSSDGGNYAATFGASSDKLVPGDYTGDGKTDIAIWQPSTGEWFILRSEDGSYYSYPFGTAGDIPAVGDFDGDGKADSAVFRPSDTNWYIRRSSDSGFTIQQFGANGDVPAVGDYDGDGKADIAI
ncbi:MAG: FG-GAP-like repeat-containing protein, partial [Pyrinomonadaceae bacterium]